MAALKKPWGKFFWSDWMSDAQLRRCSPAARALWIDMLCIAAQHEPVGYVAVKGHGLAPDDLGRMLGFTEQEATDLIAELERNGVFSRDRKGRIYSRRMIRDAKKGEIARKNGKGGGNPTLSKTKDNSASDNLPDKVQDKTHILEARGQSREYPQSTAPEGCARSSSTDPAIVLRTEIVAAMDGAMPPGDMHRTAMWIAQGYPPDLIRAVVVERIRAGKRPSSLAWFDKALAEAAAIKAPPVQPAADPKRPIPISQPQFPGDSVIDIVNPGKVAASILKPKVEAYYRSGIWPEVGFGRAPGTMGCHIPPSFLAWCGGPAIAEEVA